MGCQPYSKNEFPAKPLGHPNCIEYWQQHHQDGDIGHSWPQSPSWEDKLGTIHRQDTIVKIPKSSGEAEAPIPGPRRQRRTTLEELQEWLHSESMDLPPGQHGIVSRGPPGPLVSPVGKKENPRWTSRSLRMGDTFPEVHLSLTSQGSLGNMGRLHHWGSDRDEEEGQGL